MTQKLYEEALADAKKVAQVAEDAAKQAVLNAVVPRIRNLIESELLGRVGDSVEDQGVGPLPDDISDDQVDHPEDELSHCPPGTEFAPDVVVAPGVDVAAASHVAPPDEDGKITIDLDTIGVSDEAADGSVDGFGALSIPSGEGDEYTLSFESANSLNVRRTGIIKNHRDLAVSIRLTEMAIDRLQNSRRLVENSRQIARTIQRVENMYAYVQQSFDESNKKKILETKLENFFGELQKLQETAVSKQNRLREADESQFDDIDVGGAEDELDVGGDESGDDGLGGGGGEITLKLTGLPDVDLEDVGVDLISDEGGEEDVAAGDDELAPEGEDVGGEEDPLGGQDSQLESILRLPDDTIVEIDEGMLRREILRMKQLREEFKAPSADGNKDHSNKVLDDFGGGHPEGDPIEDVDVECEVGPLEEMDDVSLEEGDDMGLEEGEEEQCESYKRQLAKESKLQGDIRKFAKKIKEAARSARGNKLSELRTRYGNAKKKFSESVKRTTKLKKQLSEATSRNRRSNSGATRQNGNATSDLRAKLAESNLTNIKLVYANKVLQSNLTKRQQAHIVTKLDECRTPREAKLVFESFVKSVAPRRSSIDESTVHGSGSRNTRSGGAATINEGFETERWARLAGIIK